MIKCDVSVARNYLTEQEMRSLGRIVYACLDLAEDRAERHMKYRVIQDRLFMSDFDKYLLELEKNIEETPK
ncbi:RhuM family protein [Lachnospiraceae bacterium 54-11]